MIYDDCQHCQDKSPYATAGTRVMIVCQKCGNKRCPKAIWHGYECTDSNEPGQQARVEKSIKPERKESDIFDLPESLRGNHLDVERATKEYLFSTGRYENPDEVWESVPYNVKHAAAQYTRRILIAALGGDPDGL